MLRSAPLALLCVAWSGQAAAAGVEQCLSASEQGQQQRDDGELLAARESFVTCANEACPALVRRDCTTWLAAVERRTPSVVVRVVDPRGRDLRQLKVLWDGAPLGQPLSGAAFKVNPGAHLLEIKHESFRAVKKEVFVLEGEQARLVEIKLVQQGPIAADQAGSPDRAGSSAENAPERGIPTLSWVLVGVGGAALLSYGYFGLKAQGERSDLDSCKPTCDQADVDQAKRHWLLANVSFGVGVVALGAALWVGLGAESASPRAARAPRFRAGLVPSAGGAQGLFQAQF